MMKSLVTKFYNNYAIIYVEHSPKLSYIKHYNIIHSSPGQLTSCIKLSITKTNTKQSNALKINAGVLKSYKFYYVEFTLTLLPSHSSFKRWYVVEPQYFSLEILGSVNQLSCKALSICAYTLTNINSCINTIIWPFKQNFLVSTCQNLYQYLLILVFW